MDKENVEIMGHFVYIISAIFLAVIIFFYIIIPIHYSADEAERWVGEWRGECLQKSFVDDTCLCWSTEACANLAEQWIDEGKLVWDECRRGYYWHTWVERLERGCCDIPQTKKEE